MRHSSPFAANSPGAGWPRRVARVVLPLLALLLAGCYSQSVNGDIVTFSASTLILVLLFGGGFAALGFSAFKIKDEPTNWGMYVYALFGFGMIGVFGPNMLMERVVIDNRHFEIRMGSWWSPESHNIDFANVTGINVHHYVTRNRRSTTDNYDLNLSLKTGSQTIKMHERDEQVVEICRRAASLGIPVSGELP